MQKQLQDIKKALKKELDKDRYHHTVGVMYTAGCLAMKYGYDMERAMLAGLLHDCAKCISNEDKLKLCHKYKIDIRPIEEENPFLLHAKLGAYMAQHTYGVEDPEICHAIEVHTTGAPEMNLLDKILFVADYIEPNRNKAPNLPEIRQLAFVSIDEAVLKILYDTLHFLNRKRGAIDDMTQKTYTYYQELLDRSTED